MKSNSKWILIDNFIIIFDLNLGGRSVTNDIESILEKISKEVSLTGKIVIYRDSEKEYTRVLIDKNGDVYGFETPINSSIISMTYKAVLNYLFLENSEPI